MHANTPPLSGQALLDFLERAEDFWQHGFEYEPDDGEVYVPAAERRTALLEELRAQAFAPATREELERLYSLWLSLDEMKAACAAIRMHLDAVLAGIQGVQARNDARIYFTIAELWMRCEFDLDGVRARLPETLALLQSYAEEVTRARRPEDPWTISKYWHSLARSAAACKSRDIMDAALNAQRAFEREYLDKDEDDSTAVKEAKVALFKARYAARWRESEALDAHLNAAIAALQASPDIEDWDELLNVAMELSPAHIPAIIAACEAQTERLEQPPASAAIRAHRDVENARIQARAWAVQGEWDKAIEWGQRGHYVLENEPYNLDDDGAEMLGWMEAAGRMRDAADLAWRGFWYAPWGGMAEAAYTLALKMRDQDATTPAWDWILAWAQLGQGYFKSFYDGREGLLGHLDQRPPLPAEVYLERAKTIAPDHPMHDLIAGRHLAQERQWQAALPLLERSILALPEYADPPSVKSLWCARLKCLPEEEALARPFPESDGMGWCHDIGYELVHEEGFHTEKGFIYDTCADELSAHSREHRKALGLRYYEIGIARAEAFFSSGKGAYTDANVHTYSSLCDSLGYYYRLQGRVDDALALQEAGLSGRPMRRHYQEIFECLYAKGEYAALMTFAERHWHMVQQNGYQDADELYNPSHYMFALGNALREEQRHLELGIWIDRLKTWWEYCENADEDELEDISQYDYLDSLMHLLLPYSQEVPDKAAPLVLTCLPQVLALDEGSAGSHNLWVLWFNTACTLQDCGHLEDAIVVYRRVLGIVPEDETEIIRRAHENIANCEAALHPGSAPTAQKPFWKFW